MSITTRSASRARAGLSQGAWKRWRRAIPTTTRRRSPTRITLNVAASPNDKTYANQLKGAAILEPIFKRQPQHPGVAHYLIHLYDYPPIAEKGLDAAKRYAEIAPAAPHAQHMPSHIFTRVGYWKEFDRLQHRVGARGEGGQGRPSDQLHAMDYMVYAYLQLGRTRMRVPSSTR